MNRIRRGSIHCGLGPRSVVKVVASAVTLVLALTTLLFIAPVAHAADVPQEARANYDKAGIAREEGRLERAAELYRKAIEAHPLYFEAHEAYLGCLRGIGDSFAAQELYADLVAKHADSIELRAFAAAAKEPPEAIEALLSLKSEDSKNLRMGIELARAYLLSGNPKKAESGLKSIVKRAPNNAAVRTLLGDAYFARGKYKSARKEYDYALDADNTYVPAHLRLALTWHRNGKSAKALEQLGKLVSEDSYPNLVAGHWLLAMIRADMGKFDAAIKSIDKVLAVDKGDFDALIAKGHLLLRADKPVEAGKIFAKAVETKPRSSEAVFALAWSHEKAADAPGIDDAKSKVHLEAAKQAYEKCSGMDPGVRPRDSLGFVFLLKNEHAEAVTQFRRAADIDTKFPPPVNNLGLSSDMADNRAAAKKKYEQVLKKIDKKNVRAMVMLALDHWLDGASSKAIKGLEKALKLDPKDDLAWTFLGDVHTDRGKWDSAIKAYKKATDIDEGNFIAWYHMGQVLQDAKKKWEEADRCFRKALEARAAPPTQLLLRLAEVNEEEALDNPEDALKFYKQYKEAGGSTEPPWDWIDDRIEEMEKEAAKKK